MRKLLETFQELNLSNYGPDDVDQLNAWAIDAYAELSAIKAQEPVAWEVYYADDDSFHTITRNKMLIDGYSSMAYVIKPLYAAPVSEAKAQGVVMQSTDGGRNPRYEGLFDGETEEQRASRLNATPVQQVSVPDGSRLVTTDWLKRINRDLDACQKLIWANLRGCDPSYYEDAQERLREIDAMLAAAPAAPAADAWIPVSERLPGEDDQVLCWCEDETVAWAEVSSHHNSFFTDMTHELLPVTHWMPLPAAPIKIEANRHDQ